MNENIPNAVREITSVVKNFKRPMFPYGFSRNCEFCGGAPLSCCCRNVEKILKEFHEAAKRQGAIEALEKLKLEDMKSDLDWRQEFKEKFCRVGTEILLNSEDDTIGRMIASNIRKFVEDQRFRVRQDEFAWVVAEAKAFRKKHPGGSAITVFLDALERGESFID